MARALRLAARGLFTTHPNPHVGCVIVRDGAIVGEGWHQRAGEPHAEVFALRAAGERARGATAYVTLEPCAHRGRTPPCADALLAAGVARVVMAAEDTNPRAGGGAARLRAAGVAVESGLMRAAARELNRGFFSRFERGRPWVRVKLAMSVDGRTALANGDSKWITGEPARADVARWRARSSAILTGAGTTRADNPRLTVRLRAEVPSPAGRGCREAAGEGSLPRSAAASTSTVPLPPAPLPGGDGRNFVPPLRVVLDARLDAVPAGANLLDGSASTLVLHAPDAVAADGRYAGVERASVALGADGRLDLPAVLHMLAARRVNELQVEAGPTLCGALLERGLVDELLLYVAPTFLGDAARALLALPPLSDMAARVHLRVIERRRIGADLRVLLRPVAAQL
ncbi:MAG TPA: bifunctional diaminohydroxyphosphoribosylaminopyrimidine deaminase/5-amino-6-(5-phosphoribosylamino)uracil reductase RibD [Rhodanobacteraceae bacterium]